MKRTILILATALSLSACGVIPASVASAPAPLAQTTFDDKALRTAWDSLDVAADAINLVLDVKPRLVGTPAMIKAADALDATSAALSAAEAAVAAGSTTKYSIALAQAKKAMADLRVALLALKGK